MIHGDVYYIDVIIPKEFLESVLKLNGAEIYINGEQVWKKDLENKPNLRNGYVVRIGVYTERSRHWVEDTIKNLPLKVRIITYDAEFDTIITYTAKTDDKED